MKLSRDVNPLLLMVVLAILVVAASTVIDPNNNDLLFGLTIAAGFLWLIWTFPQAYEPRAPRKPRR